MMRFFLALVLLHSFTAVAAECGYVLSVMDGGGDVGWRSGCLISGGEVGGWNGYGSTLSSQASTLSSYGSTLGSHSSTITAQAAQIAALQAAVTALQEGGGESDMPVIFTLTEQQGTDIAIAILMLWAVAWIFRVIISVVKQDEKD